MLECTPRRFVVALMAACLAAAGPRASSQSGDQPSSTAAPGGGQQQADSAPVPQGTQPARPGKEVPRPQDLEPGVNTSATPPGSGASSSGSSPATAGASNQGAPARAEPSRGADGKTTTASRSRPAQKPAGPGAEPRPGAASGKAHDKIELDTTQITGNRELPKVLYIVPWKRSDLGDLVGKPVNSLLDEVLTPVDRDVFRRQNRYYDALKPDSAKDAAAAGASEKP